MRHLRCGFLLQVLLFFVGSGCAILCPEPSARVLGEWGEVRVDFPACRKLRLVDHRAWRDEGGRLVVRTEWRNVSAGPFTAQVRAVFFDEEGGGQETEDGWTPHTFAPGGGHIIECSSAMPGAVGYLIEVKSTSRWPF